MKWPIMAAMVNEQSSDLFPHFFSQDVFQPEHERYNPVDEEPLYVNAKQYSRIMKRREIRLRLEEVHRLSRQRKVFFFFFFLFYRSFSHFFPSLIFMNLVTSMLCDVPGDQVVVFSLPKKLPPKKLLRQKLPMQTTTVQTMKIPTYLLTPN